MRMKLPIILILMSLVKPVYGYLDSVFYLLQFRSDNVTNAVLTVRFTNYLLSAFRDKGFYALDGFTKGPEGEDPEYMMNGTLSYRGDEYVMTLVVVNITNQGDRWQDEVYTRDMTGTDGFREAAQALARRSDLFRRHQRVKIYKERTDFLKIQGRSDTSGFRKSIEYIDLFRIVNVHAVYPYGHDFGIPIRFGLDFFDYNFIWTFGTNTTFGAGIGTKVFAYRGPLALSFLPLQVYVPLFIFPNDHVFNRRDLYLHFEAGFFLLQYSYIDVNFKLVLNGVTVTLGCLYLPLWGDGTNVRPEYWTIYGGLTFSFGSYGVHWR